MCDHLGTVLDCRRTHVYWTSSAQRASYQVAFVTFCSTCRLLDVSDQQKSESGMIRVFFTHKTVQDVLEAVLET